MVADRPFSKVKCPLDIVLKVLENKSFNDTLNGSSAILEVRFTVEKLVQELSKACVQLSRTTCIAYDGVRSKLKGRGRS